MHRFFKSTISSNPLREPGQSVREQQRVLLFDKLLPVGTIILMLWFVAGLEWAWVSSGLRPDPVFWALIAGLVTLYGVGRGWPLIQRFRYLALGYRGERAVGEFLDRLRILGYRVYHDVPGEGGNIDHVIISSRGIFAVETRTCSAPAKGPRQVQYDCEAVSMNGSRPDPAPIIQARAQAAKLERLLHALTGEVLPVRPMVVYPGWFVERRKTSRTPDVQVLSPKGLYKWLEREPQTIPGETVRRAARHLAAHLRKNHRQAADTHS